MGQLLYRNKLTLLLSIFAIFSCSALEDEYQSEQLSPLPIDEQICSILESGEAYSVISYSLDSLSLSSYYDSLVMDTSSFVTLSNTHSWNIDLDSSGKFILYAPQPADSYYVVLNSSSHINLFNSNADTIKPSSTDITLKNIAGCPQARVRHVYSNLSGTYLASVVNTNVSSVGMVVLNTNLAPIADFNVSNQSCILGDTLSFTDNSVQGDYPIRTYSWNFDDGAVVLSDTSVISYLYSDSGVFSPSLTVSDGFLQHTVIKTDFVTVSGSNGATGN